MRKKRFAALLLPLMLMPLAGCGHKIAARPAGDTIAYNYTIINNSEQYELYDKYAFMAYMLREKSENKDIDDISESELFADSTVNTDINVEDELKKMDDLADDVFSENTDNITIYADKQHPELMIFSTPYDTWLSGFIADMPCEYADLCADIQAKTGLLYAGTELGMHGSNYSGRNIISFTNQTFRVMQAFNYSAYDVSFSDTPFKINFFMDDDEISFIQIYCFSGEKASAPNDQNTASLDFGGDAGKTAQTLFKKYANAKTDTNGTLNGIKYSIITNASDDAGDMHFNVLTLDLKQ